MKLCTKAAGQRRALLAPQGHNPPVLTLAMRTALGLLLQAHETATGLHCDPWDFALEIHALKEAGVSHNDLRALVCQGLSEQRLEETRRGAPHRSFGPPRSIRLHADSCFALSQKGLLVAQNMDCDRSSTQADNRSPTLSASIPSWDSARRELRLGTAVVKRFRQPAHNQETILAAFQEDGWPPRIDSPLSGNAETCAVDRLHEAVKKLNRHTRCMVRFLSDGAGLGVLWELTSDPGAA